jgi:hypothetical protein
MSHVQYMDHHGSSTADPTGQVAQACPWGSNGPINLIVCGIMKLPRPSKYPQIRWFTRLFLASLHFLGGIWQVYMTVSENGKCILIGQMNPLGF